MGNLKFLRVLVLMVAITVAAAACRDNTPSLPAVGEQVVLKCNDMCTARGQCGTVNGSQPVVLANEAGPAVRFQDRFFNDGTLVTLVEMNERSVIAAVDGAPQSDTTTPFPHAFYRAQDQAGKTAWVSSWCMERP